MSSISSQHLPYQDALAVSPAPVQMSNPQQKTDASNTIKLYLNDVLVELTTDQTQQIIEILSSRTNTEPQNEEIVPSRIQGEYIFDVNNTFLHSMFKETTAKKIKHIIDHKLSLILVVTSLIAWFALRAIFGWDHAFFNVYSIIICIYWIPWFTFKHFLLNQVAFKLCIQTFDFWIKLCYGIIVAVGGLFHTPSPTTLVNIREPISNLVPLLAISYISSFDAEYCHKTKKLIVAVITALWATYFAVAVQFLWEDGYYDEIVIPLPNGGEKAILVQSLMASSYRIIAIFFWKQSYKTWQSSNAVTIVESPKLTWITGDAKSTEQHLDETVN